VQKVENNASNYQSLVHLTLSASYNEIARKNWQRLLKTDRIRQTRLNILVFVRSSIFNTLILEIHLRVAFVERNRNVK